MSNNIEATACAAPDCGTPINNFTTFIRLPWDRSRFNLWLDKIPVDSRTVKPGDWLCYRHFEDLRNKEVKRREYKRRILRVDIIKSADEQQNGNQEQLEEPTPILPKYLGCCVPDCSILAEPSSLCAFPKDEIVANKWLSAIGRSGERITSRMRICKLHFRKDPDKDQNALPTLFLPEYVCKTCRAMAQKQRYLQKEYDQYKEQYEEDLRKIEELKRERDVFLKEYELLKKIT